ncbi:MAG: hypothetical protein EOM80_17905 [Erysipelotrichia bacterium]|nr:hypothetical protein [Erysipelotrichia bacterium]
MSGIEELKKWEPHDLFQFYHDTEQIFGSIEFMKELIKFLQEPERKILETGNEIKEKNGFQREEFERLSGELLRWASGLIRG